MMLMIFQTQALELAAKNVVAIVGPGSTSVAVHLASLMGIDFKKLFESSCSTISLPLYLQLQAAAEIIRIHNLVI